MKIRRKSLSPNRKWPSLRSSLLAKISEKYGAEIPFIRPKKLSGDLTPIGDVFVHAIKKLQTLNYEFDVFVNLDCTVPFIDKKDILYPETVVDFL